MIIHKDCIYCVLPKNNILEEDKYVCLKSLEFTPHAMAMRLKILPPNEMESYCCVDRNAEYCIHFEPREEK